MNTPNKLTVFRISMVPVITAILCLFRGQSLWLWISCGLFIVASLTDLLDGHLARKNNQITNFGKFMDPLADKLLVCAVLICLIDWTLVPAWAVILIVAREFAISGIRLIAAEKGVVLAASPIAKVKTNVQMIWVIYLMIPLEWSFRQPLAWVLLAASVFLTLISFLDYVIKNAGLLKEQS
ncbi:MAG: CDP-diacylglycerol--glycerol-3-phosphate 3-phosphatidyltransferase [Lachnospiraceae bacterium]|nr:CDP-diacylglycerol--glycerol-3-phosphate 3-phosphatidyltransferase [Lachnospiraceae bacterium]